MQDQGLSILNAVKTVEYKCIKPKIITQEVILIDVQWRENVCSVLQHFQGFSVLSMCQMVPKEL